MQTELLWNFMQHDMEVDRFENEMRQSPRRVKLLKQRDFLLEQQNTIKRIEQEVTAMYDRLEAVKDEADRLSEQLAALSDALAKDPPEALEDVRKQLAAVQKLENSLARYEQELTKMRKDSEARDRQQKEIRLRAARTKAEFDKLKGEYDVEFKQDNAKLTALREKAEKESAAIDAKVLDRYRATKQHVVPPVAKMNGDRCGGCNMNLPAAMLGRLRAGEEIECDNCGRMLILE